MNRFSEMVVLNISSILASDSIKRINMRPKNGPSFSPKQILQTIEFIFVVLPTNTLVERRICFVMKNL